MQKDSIVVYDITDKISDLVAVIDFGTSPDSFFYDSILKTYNPQSITLTQKVYLNGVLQTSNLTYVWKKNGTQISTTSTASISQPSDTSPISVSLEVTYTYTDSGTTLKQYDSVTINVVNIDSTPTVIINPATAIFKTADTSPITVTQQVMYKGQDITGSTSVTSKQWYKGTTAISGQTSSSYSIPRSDVGNTFRFDATINSVTYSQSVQQVEAKEGVSPVFVQISGPTDFVYVDGTANVSSLTLTCSAQNLQSPTYQWQYYSGSQWTNISGQTSATLSIPNTQTYIGTQTNVRCQVTSSGNTFTSNELTIKRIYNYTKQLVITPVNGTFFNQNLTSLTFKQNLVDLTNQFTTTDITSTQTWKLTTGSNTTTVTPSGGVVTINRNNVSNSQILEATYGQYKNQIVINDLADSATMEIVQANGNHVHFYSNGTSDPQGGQLTFNAKIYQQTGQLINPQPSQLSWSTIPDQQSIGGSLIPGSSPVPKQTLVKNPDGSQTVTIDSQYNDQLSVQCTYSNGQTNISSTMPIIVTRDQGGQTLLVIDQPNGTIYTTQDLNETKTFNLSFYNNGVKQPAIVDEANNYYIRWYMGQTLIASNVDTISIQYGQISGATQNLHQVYSFNGTIYDQYLSISKIQLSGNTSLQITQSNGLELTNESQTTNLTQTLYVNGEQILSNVSYSWSNGKSDRIISVKTSDVFVMQTYTCTVTYQSETYTASQTVIDKTDSYQLKIFESSGSTEKYQFQVSIQQSSAVQSTNLQVMPKLYLGSSLVNTGNISINVIGKNGNSTYSIQASGAQIQIPLSKLVTQEEVTTISTTVTANIVQTYTPSGGSTSVVLTQIISVVISNQMYSWLANWKGNTDIGANSIATGKLFVGTPDGTGVTGVYIGNGNDTISSKSYDPGIVQVKNNQEKFYVKYQGNNISFHVGDNDSYVNFDTTSQQVDIKAKVEIIGNSNVQTVDDQQMQLPDGQSAYFTISPIDQLNGLIPDGIDPQIIEANGFGNNNSTYNLLNLIGHPNDRTIIDGGKIFANSIKAFQIDSETLFSKYFTIKDGGQLVSEGKTGYNNSTVGVYIDKSGIEIYKNADTYFRFDINNGINLQQAGVTFGSSGLQMTQGSISLSSGKILLSNDGSGSVQNGGISWTTGGSITIGGSATVNGVLQLSPTGKIYTGGKSTYGSTEKGIFIGYDSSEYRLYIGDTQSYIKYYSDKIEVSGTLQAGSVLIGKNVRTVGSNNYHGIKFSDNDYWTSDGTLKLASGKISFDGSTLTINGSGTFSGSITATSGSIATALAIGPTAKIGIGVSGSNNGLLLNSTNYWYDSGTFNVGSSTSFINWNGSALLINGGKLQVGSSAFGPKADGTNDGLYINSTNYWYTNGNFKIGDGTNFLSWTSSPSSLVINNGLIYAGTVKLGKGVNGTNNGIQINNDNYWYQSGNLKVGNSANYLSWDGSNLTISNGTINIGSTIKLGYNANGTGNHGIVLNENNYWYYNSSIQQLKVGNSGTYLQWDGTNLAINNATLSVGSIKVGKEASSGKDGIYIDDSNYWYNTGETGEFKVGGTKGSLSYDSSSGLQLIGNNIGITVTNGSKSSSFGYFKDSNNKWRYGLLINNSNYIYDTGEVKLGTADQAKFEINPTSNQIILSGANVSVIGSSLIQYSKIATAGEILQNNYYVVNQLNNNASADLTLDDNQKIVFQQLSTGTADDQRLNITSIGQQFGKIYATNDAFVIEDTKSNYQNVEVFQQDTASKTVSSTSPSVTLYFTDSNSITYNQKVYRYIINIYKRVPTYFLIWQTGTAVQLHRTITADISGVIGKTSGSLPSGQVEMSVTVSNLGSGGTQNISVTLKNNQNASNTQSYSISDIFTFDHVEIIAYITKKVPAATDDTYATEFRTGQNQLLTKIQGLSSTDKSTYNLSLDPGTETPWGQVTQQLFKGRATSQSFADVQENIYQDEQIDRCVPVQLKNGKMVKAYNPFKKFYIVSYQPGLLLGSERTNQIPVQLTGSTKINTQVNLHNGDKICLDRHQNYKVANTLDKVLGKYIIGEVIDQENQIIFIY